MAKSYWSSKLSNDESDQYMDEWSFNNSEYYKQPDAVC